MLQRRGSKLDGQGPKHFPSFTSRLKKASQLFSNCLILVMYIENEILPTSSVFFILFYLCNCSAVSFDETLKAPSSFGFLLLFLQMMRIY